jgi:S-adenosylmethionine:tRNA ribosyltransferase-isomerase
MAAAGVNESPTWLAHLDATEPPEASGRRRDDVRLLVSQLDNDSIVHSRFSELPHWLSAGDLLVVNTSGTLNAALSATASDGDRVDVHLSTRLPGEFWVVEIRRAAPIASRPYQDAHAGTTYDLNGGGKMTVLAPYPFKTATDTPSRLWLAALQLRDPLLPYLHRYGRPIRYSYVPEAWPESMYQTIFATEPGSAEMPSAARPFTPEVVTGLVSNGIQIAPLLLHTGVASLEDHEPPYEEYFRVSLETARIVNATKQSGHRVVAVGTTVVRALETVTDRDGTIHPGEGWTSLVITPERRVRAVNAMITGLHEPRATHLAMVRQVIAAAGSSQPSVHLDSAYHQAQQAGYLWHEFGDSHLILGGSKASEDS